eukprot:m.49135 g.49135  ORF g.49135 m.49135 type:complete len:119 (+) comp15301_c0_seq6:1463-1819(+)
MRNAVTEKAAEYVVVHCLSHTATSSRLATPSTTRPSRGLPDAGTTRLHHYRRYDTHTPLERSTVECIGHVCLCAMRGPHTELSQQRPQECCQAHENMHAVTPVKNTYKLMRFAVYCVP